MVGSKIGVIFDYDDTLVPDTATELLKKYGIDHEKFWGEDVKQLLLEGYDPTHAYLKLILNNIGEGKPFGKLTNKDLRAFGKTFDDKFSKGIPEVFTELKEKVKQYKDIDIEFYIISGGLREIIIGSDVVKNNFTSVYGCDLAGDTEDDYLKYVKRAITFTEKTRYIFEINKGITQDEVKENAYLVNKDVPVTSRRIPLSNMIYIGDGLTDIPCFSLITKASSDHAGNGFAFAVFDSTKPKSAKQALQEYLMPKRVTGAYSPKFDKDSDLGSVLRAVVTTQCANITLRNKEPK
ncbi:HAD family hydrolase [Candidatus Nitrosotenuis chungbukensis]|uniref:HAD family hydrolase n=1 Tax=Candidatus Nitrosotenuis chungbukensis TaxID=1353246 RepID=UPI0005B2584B|nr:HAD family hydrolase [Candidatus Nitrosotenuis chungbukensis]WKT57170.1 HAD family hydrolase [Candidatus Nitrosotenuis chungbukensis]